MHATADQGFRRITHLVMAAASLTALALVAHLAGLESGWVVTTALVGALVAWAVMLRQRRWLRSSLLRRDTGYFGMFEGHPQPILLADDATLRIIAVNAAARAKYGYTDEEFAGLAIFDLHRDQDRDDVRAGWAEMGNAAGEARSVGLHVAKDGTTFAAEVVSATIEIDGRLVRMKVVIDVTERDEALTEATEKGARYRQVVETAREGVVTVNADMAISEVNTRAAEMLDYSPEELIGRQISELIGPEGTEPAWTETTQWMEGGLTEERETTLQAKDGRMVPVLIRGGRLEDTEGEYSGQLGMITDLTEQRGLEDELEFQGIHDPLTGLPNRLLLVDRLERALGRATSKVAVVLVGIDGFKRVNDSYGHDAGDCVLVEVAGRLSSNVTEGDTVGRFGGDEFVVVSEGVSRSAESLAEALRAAIAGAYLVDDASIDITFSMGVATGQHGDRPATLLRDADLALLQAKAKGRGRTEFVTEAMRSTSTRRLLMWSELRRAVEQSEFSLRFQPVVAISDRSIVGAEALIRWDHPERGVLAPDEFIAVAEDSGLIVPIGQWVIEEACGQLAAWRRLMPELMMAVNVSAQQFSGASLVDTVRDAVTATGVPGSQLVLEITESVLMDDVALSVEVLAQLRRTGVKIALDDFGTGYSSLAYLQRFPIDILKIDRSFVAGLGDDSYDRALIEAVIALASSLTLAVVAEGVENAVQAGMLIAMGCRRAQGFYFHRPLEAEAFEDALVASLALTRARERLATDIAEAVDGPVPSTAPPSP